MALYVKQSGTWTQIPNGTGVRYKASGSWNDIQTLSTKVSGTWRTVWQKSDPLTANFYATFSTAMRHSAGGFATYDPAGTASDNSEADVFIGYFGGSNPYHYTSVVDFGNAHDEGQLTITQYLATRPNITSAELRLTRYNSGSSTLGASNIYTGNWTQSGFTSLPTPDLDGSEHDWDHKETTAIGGWSFDSQKTIDVDPQAVIDMNNGAGLMIAGTDQQTGYTTASVDGSGTTTNYSRIYGVANANTDARKIQLSVTFDF